MFPQFGCSLFRSPNVFSLAVGCKNYNGLEPCPDFIELGPCPTDMTWTLFITRLNFSKLSFFGASINFDWKLKYLSLFFFFVSQKDVSFRACKKIFAILSNKLAFHWIVEKSCRTFWSSRSWRTTWNRENPIWKLFLKKGLPNC